VRSLRLAGAEVSRHDATRRCRRPAQPHYAAEKGETMRAIIEKLKKDDGLSTAEYAVGTVAAAGLGGVLIKLLTSPEVRDLIWSVLSNAFKSMLG
jgi:hypothetical protein